MEKLETMLSDVNPGKVTREFNEIMEKGLKFDKDAEEAAKLPAEFSFSPLSLTTPHNSRITATLRAAVIRNKGAIPHENPGSLAACGIFFFSTVSDNPAQFQDYSHAARGCDP